MTNAAELISEFKAGTKIMAERQVTTKSFTNDPYAGACRETEKTIAEIHVNDNGWVMVKLKGSKRLFRMYRNAPQGVVITSLRSMFPKPLAYEVY